VARRTFDLACGTLVDLRGEIVQVGGASTHALERSVLDVGTFTQLRGRLPIAAGSITFALGPLLRPQPARRPRRSRARLADGHRDGEGPVRCRQGLELGGALIVPARSGPVRFSGLET